MINIKRLLSSLVSTFFLCLLFGACQVPQTNNPPSALTASFTYTPASPVVGQSVQFKDTSTGSPTSWQWNFGDGGSSTAQNPSHTFTPAGSYTVTLTIRAGSNLSNTSEIVSVRIANTITAASPSLADVKAAIASASPGDTVLVPAGTATWSGHVPFLSSTTDLVLTRGIILIGAGIGQTNITFSSPFGIGYQPSSTAFADNDSFRISGFTFAHSGHSDWGRNYGAICLYGAHYTNALAKNRIDHVRFYRDAGTALWVTGPMWGVADNCTFEQTSNPYRSVFIPIRGTGGDRDMWDNFPLNLDQPFGQSDQFYIEDSTMIGDIWFEGGQGGRYCVRHCASTGKGINGDSDVFDAHGNQPGGGVGDNYATMKVEIYENAFSQVAKPVRFVAVRGGKVLVYNNTVSGTSDITATFLNSYEEYSDYRSPVNNPATSIQHPNDCYLFNNTKNGAKFTDLTISETLDYNSTADAPYTPNPPYRVVPQKDRDLWWEQSSFDGSSGVGVGPLSNRPSSCSTEGVGWWATDQSILYRWHNGAWQSYYTPFTYPHPLRSAPIIGD